MKHKFILIVGILVILLVSCQPEVVSEIKDSTEPATQITPSLTATVVQPTVTAEVKPITPTKNNSPASKGSETPAALPITPVIPSATPVANHTATARAEPNPDEWKEWPVIPTISDSVYEIYQRGQELEINPRAFSKIGDCGSTPAWFLGDFDRGSEFYRLGEYEYLEDVIAYYQGSFDRTSLAARSGFNTSSLFVSLWADRSQCESNETPLACELRVNQPAIAFITLGTNDVWHPDEFESQMTKIIDFTLEYGVIPVLSTKADNTEGDHQINATIAMLAYEYDIPMWNYWLAVQELPNQGLQEDGSHLTWGRNFFDDPQMMEKAWPVRNLNALQILNAIWNKLQNMEN